MKDLSLSDPRHPNHFIFQKGRLAKEQRVFITEYPYPPGPYRRAWMAGYYGVGGTGA